MPWRANNRQTALRLPAIRRLRIAATISSSVKSGCSAISASKKSACFSSGEMLPPVGLAATLPVFAPALHPFDSRAGAHLEAFGRLASRRTRFNRVKHTLAQVQRTWFRHRSPSKNRIDAARTRSSKDPRESPDSTQPRCALARARRHSWRGRSLQCRCRKLSFYLRKHAVHWGRTAMRILRTTAAVAVSAIALALILIAPAFAADPIGTWLTGDKKGKVKIVNCGGAICGTLTVACGAQRSRDQQAENRQAIMRCKQARPPAARHPDRARA